MIIPDLNLLLYAYRAGAPEHASARAWWEDALGGEREIGLTNVTVFGFIRLMTHPRIANPPAPVDEVVARVEQWFDSPNVRLLVPGPRHLEIAFRLLREQGTAADLTTDVQLAAFAMEHQGEVHSNDTDFGRFAGLKWVNPLDQM